MPLELNVPAAGPEYQRTFEAEIDVVDAGRIFVRGRMRDHRVDIEHTWLLATPEYEVLEAGARQHGAQADAADPALCARYSGVRGARIGRGFSKRILEALGDERPGRQEHLLLAIEMARVGQQVYQFPSDFDARFAPSAEVRSPNAFLSWEKDRAYMGSLVDSCYTYRDASAELFRSREVVCGITPELTRPEPGTQRAFWRRKRLAIRGSGDTPPSFECESAMQDSLHDISIGFRLGADGTISAARSAAARVPYAGICEDPHRRVQALEGVRVSAEFMRQLADHIGGSQGCTHLFDLSVDCLRMFRL